MNKYPNLNVLCLSNSTYLKNELWSSPTRINACLFSQASRIVLFIPDDGSEHITYFTRHCLQPLLCNSREEGGRPEWHSRFVAVAIGNVQVPNQLNSETPFINVIRFREIGWFRDIMGMMLLERAIKGKLFTVMYTFGSVLLFAENNPRYIDCSRLTVHLILNIFVNEM
ncbi:unnamed protein product [Trichobilharzia regenti]|nr:unnamed protein product [Trichobilharzia regenti]